MKAYFEKIFSIRNKADFNESAMEAFHFQIKHNPIYIDFIRYLGKSENTVKCADEIPYLPIEFFKSKKVYAGQGNEEIIFSSSGTTGAITSSHYVYDLNVYRNSFEKSFQLFYGKPQDYCILALLPSYLERGGSSLVYMADHLIKESKHPKSNFYLNDMHAIMATINELKEKRTKTILLGVSYALLDLADAGCKLNDDFIVMETGGMKGKRREMLKEELHQYLQNCFEVSLIHSEYGMTELLSQAYSHGKGIYRTPPWMQVSVREVNDPFSSVRYNKTGGINIIDLANLYSCPFIATQDLGKIHENATFEILGRFDNSDLRGCNLLVQ